VTQYSLQFDGMGIVDGATDRLNDLFAAGVRRIGTKRCAFDLGTTEPNLSNAMVGRDRHPRKLDWLSYVVINDVTTDIPAFIASLRGLDTVPAVPPDPVEELTATREALAELLGPELRVALMACVRRKLAEGRR
jgi:hypothetical protein